MIESKKILAIVPARGGSKGVKGKNLRKFRGKSLTRITIESAMQSRYIDKLIISSDDQKIIDEATFYGAQAPFVRPEELAQDESSTADVVLHAINSLDHYDIIVLLQTTSPLRTIEDIDACIEFYSKNQVTSCVSVCESNKSPHWIFNKTKNNQLRKIVFGDSPKRRQDAPPVYELNGAIYIVDTNWFKENKTFMGDYTEAFVMPKERSIDIDTELDFYLLTAIDKFNRQNEADTKEKKFERLCELSREQFKLLHEINPINYHADYMHKLYDGYIGLEDAQKKVLLEIAEGKDVI